MQNRKARVLLTASLLAFSLASAPHAPAAQEEIPPAEELRLNRREFLDGLNKRGLDEMLDLHLRDFPPREEAAHLLLLRERKLALFNDGNLPPEERHRAVGDANDLLARLIEVAGDDARRFNWMFTLAHSLIYDEAEPLFTRILYRGSRKADRQRLEDLTGRAVNVLSELKARLEVEYERIDKLSIKQFEQYERSGYTEEIDALGPRADYLRLWALFYNSLPREDHDPTRVAALHEISEYFAQHADVVDTPHDASRVQIQACLLAGMTKRRLNNHSSARQLLDKAVSLADRLADDAERRRVQWAVILAWIERIRNDRDDGYVEDALRGVARFREQIGKAYDDNFGLHVVAALLERSIQQLRADTAARRGPATEATRLKEQAWQPFARLAEKNPERRPEIYAALYSLIDPAADPQTLDPYEQCALIAGLLTEGEGDADAASASLERAVAVGQQFLAQPATGAEALIPEVLYNVGVAEYRRGRLADAARRFHQVAEEHPSFENALDAANFAIQLSSTLYEDPALRDHPEVQELYLRTLATLVRHFKDSEPARYWRFYYAQLLEELERYDEAATQYALVHGGHEHRMDAMFFRLRSLAEALQAAAGDPSEDLLALRRRADAFFVVQRDFVTQTAEPDGTADAADAARWKGYVARSQLLAAEVQVLEGVGRHAQALDTLKAFEEEFPEETAVHGRVWRVRLLAYEQLGRLDEAARAIPAYVAAGPAEAGPTLQVLYLALADEVKRLRVAGDDRAAQRKAEVALIVARQIAEWDEEHNRNGTASDHRAVKVQLAEAYLRAGENQAAKEQFEALSMRKDAASNPVEPVDLAVEAGYAEAIYQLHEFDAALPRFNELAVKLPPEDPLRWQCLLRDLQCRTALNEAPAGIIKVIQQQRHLFPELGGSALAGEFERLQRENQRRLDGG